VGMIADGLTVFGPSALVGLNVFLDNSDCNLICFGAPGGWIWNNFVRMTRQWGSTGMMLDNGSVGDGIRGNFIGLMVQGNTIECNGVCDFGLQVGPYTWYNETIGTTWPTPRVYGGYFADNSVQNYNLESQYARQGINLAGAGTDEWPVWLDDSNVVVGGPYSGVQGGYQGRAGCPSGYHEISAYNADPGTVVVDGPSPPPWTSMFWELCP